MNAFLKIKIEHDPFDFFDLRSRVINGRAAISADMAIRFAQWLGGSAETWLRAQAQYDLWQAERGKRIKVKPVARLAIGV